MAKNFGTSTSQPNQGGALPAKSAPSRVNKSNPGGAPAGSTPSGGSDAWTHGQRVKPIGGTGTERSSRKSF